MKMEIKLIKSVKKGFILTRKPETVDKELYISFLGAPSGATAIFENEKGDSLYRELSDGLCSIPVDFLGGEIKTTVAHLNGIASADRYFCEGIYTAKKGNVVIVCPNGIDIPLQIFDILTKMQDIEKNMTALGGKYTELNSTLKKLIEGYDFD